MAIAAKLDLRSGQPEAGRAFPTEWFLAPGETLRYCLPNESVAVGLPRRAVVCVVYVGLLVLNAAAQCVRDRQNCQDSVVEMAEGLTRRSAPTWPAREMPSAIAMPDLEVAKHFSV